ncbi:hypothetical protein [Streptomyces sp. 5-6(2022)]|uniref:hypothetical protein n=1 Tax=Streptomyces sp. 5-6(2022) TaxID=2936510 RepID=UPI0023B9277F|nr:hypothetical protein [Streptomyces sp. 5-6(2022)]
MGDNLRSLDAILANPNGLSDTELNRLRGERVLGAAAILLHQQGEAASAALAADVTSTHLFLWDTDFGMSTYKAVLEVEPHLLLRYTDDALEQIIDAMRAVTARDSKMAVGYIEAVPTIPEVSVDWRKQLRTASGPKPTNQARRARLEPQHPMEDGLHFTNEWEHRVYSVLKERQAALPDNETIGIVPLGAMRVRSHTYEPDLLITYRGRAGVIEIDGPHHKGRASNDKSRERLLRNAGIHYIDRLDVQDTTQKQEVEKFVTDFLKHLGG